MMMNKVTTSYVTKFAAITPLMSNAATIILSNAKFYRVFRSFGAARSLYTFAFMNRSTGRNDLVERYSDANRCVFNALSS